MFNNSRRSSQSSENVQKIKEEIDVINRYQERLQQSVEHRKLTQTKQNQPSSSRIYTERICNISNYDSKNKSKAILLIENKVLEQALIQRQQKIKKIQDQLQNITLKYNHVYNQLHKQNAYKQQYAFNYSSQNTSLKQKLSQQNKKIKQLQIKLSQSQQRNQKLSIEINNLQSTFSTLKVHNSNSNNYFIKKKSFIQTEPLTNKKNQKIQNQRKRSKSVSILKSKSKSKTPQRFKKKNIKTKNNKNHEDQKMIQRLCSYLNCNKNSIIEKVLLMQLNLQKLKTRQIIRTQNNQY